MLRIVPRQEGPECVRPTQEVRTADGRLASAAGEKMPLSSFLFPLPAEGGGEESPGYKLVRVKSSLRSFPERRPRRTH